MSSHWERGSQDTRGPLRQVVGSENRVAKNCHAERRPDESHDNLPPSELFIWSMKLNQVFKDPGETNEQIEEQRRESVGRCGICIVITVKTDIETGLRSGLEFCCVAMGKQALGKKLLFIS